MNRRNFLSWVGVGTLATSLPVALAACNPDGQNADTASPAVGDDSSEPAATDDTAAAPDGTAQGEGFVPAGTVTDLDEQGFIANEDLAAGPVIIIRNPDQPDALVALDSRCPHRGCAVEWQASDNQFLCPCHQSAFEPDGSLITGPATQSLKALEVRLDGDQVLIKA